MPIDTGTVSRFIRIVQLLLSHTLISRCHIVSMTCSLVQYMRSPSLRLFSWCYAKDYERLVVLGDNNSYKVEGWQEKPQLPAEPYKNRRMLPRGRDEDIVQTRTISYVDQGGARKYAPLSVQSHIPDHHNILALQFFIGGIRPSLFTLLDGIG